MASICFKARRFISGHCLRKILTILVICFTWICILQHLYSGSTASSTQITAQLKILLRERNDHYHSFNSTATLSLSQRDAKETNQLDSKEIALKLMNPFVKSPERSLPTMDYPVERNDTFGVGSSAKGIILFTRYRSGSTFLSELLRQHPDIFCMYEPLKLFSETENTVNATAVGEIASEHLKRFLSCDFHSSFGGEVRRLPHFKKWVSKAFCFEYDMRGPMCKPYNLQRYEAFCRSDSVKAAKIISVHHINYLRPLLEEGYKVIHLVRDPRGMISSVAKIERAEKHLLHVQYFLRYQESLLNRTKEYCDQVHGTLQQVRTLKRDLRMRSVYQFFRYEDVANKPREKASELYKYLDLRLDDNVEKWINESTMGSKSKRVKRGKLQAYSTKRNSSEAAKAWRNHLPFSLVDEVQKYCADLMNELGYKIFSKHSEMVNSESTTLPIDSSVIQYL